MDPGLERGAAWDARSSQLLDAPGRLEVLVNNRRTVLRTSDRVNLTNTIVVTEVIANDLRSDGARTSYERRCSTSSQSQVLDDEREDLYLNDILQPLGDLVPVGQGILQRLVIRHVLFRVVTVEDLLLCLDRLENVVAVWAPAWTKTLLRD
jgi:hypothetical protein